MTGAWGSRNVLGFPPMSASSSMPGSRRVLIVCLVGTFSVIFYQLLGHQKGHQGNFSRTTVLPAQKPEAEEVSPLPPAPEPAPEPQKEARQEPDVESILAEEAEKRFLASLMKKPTPPPVRPTPEMIRNARVNQLVSQARSLRERGDITTALTRLREALAISPENPLIISEIAVAYEQMGLPAKAAEQWRRITRVGEAAGDYFTLAQQRLRLLDQERMTRLDEAAESVFASNLLGASMAPPTLLLGQVEITDDTGNSQPLRALKLLVPIHAVPEAKVDVGEVVIQVLFYDAYRDGTVVQTNAIVNSSWVSKLDENGNERDIDWSTPEAEVLEVTYQQTPPDYRERKQTYRNYFGYVVRVYYKGVLNATAADPPQLLKMFPPPTTLQTTDFPQ